MNVAWVVLHCNRRIGARERRQLIPHVRFQVPFLGPESQLKSGFACAGLPCTCLAGIWSATSHSEKNSITRSSRSARTPFTVLQGFARRCAGHLAAERTRPQRKVFPSSIPMVDKQCNSSDVSCGGIAGSSCG